MWKILNLHKFLKFQISFNEPQNSTTLYPEELDIPWPVIVSAGLPQHVIVISAPYVEP